MPVDLGAGDLIMVRLEYSDESDLSDTAFNVLHYQIKNVTVTETGLPAAIRIPAASMLQSVAHTMYDAWIEKWKVFASEDVVMTGCTAQKIRGEPRSIPYHYTPEAPTSGTILGDSLPMQTR